MSAIQWTDETWNWLVGCSRISPGCAHCYAADAAKSARLQQFPQYQAVKDWDGIVQFVENQLDKPLKRRKPTRYFTCSMSDVFHENVSDEWRDRAFAVMASCPQHTFQVLTKRPERMLEYMRSLDLRRLAKHVTPLMPSIANWKLPLHNVWLGTTVESQAMADSRIPLLMRTPAAVRFLSCEPLLEKVDIKKWLNPVISTHKGIGYLNGDALAGTAPDAQIDWVIIGGESGSKARYCRTDWIRSLVQQCRAAEVPPFVKQLGNKCGEKCYGPGRLVPDHEDLPVLIRDRKGGDIDEWPKDLRVREFPAIAQQGGTP